jgi:hypothetical protein
MRESEVRFRLDEMASDEGMQMDLRGLELELRWI